MQTLRTNVDTAPRFEYYPDQSTAMRTVPVESYPFTIGRGEAVDLQINSNCVSREHATLTNVGAGYRIRDLESTNGTKVNGQPTTEADLHDGDTVGIANIELAFICSAVGRLERMATQPLKAEPAPSPAEAFSQEIALTRGVGEALLWQTIPLHWSSIQTMKSGIEYASRASIAAPLADQLQSMEANDAFSLPSRVQQVAWRLAAEKCPEWSLHGGLLLLTVRQGDFHEQLLDSLEIARGILTGSRRLGIVIPWEWASSSSEATRLCAELCSNGLSLAFESFDRGASYFKAMEGAPPSFLILANNVVRGLSLQQRRLQRLEMLRASCEASGTRLVIPDGMSGEDEAACGRLGIDLVVRESGAGSGESYPCNEHVLV